MKTRDGQTLRSYARVYWVSHGKRPVMPARGDWLIALRYRPAIHKAMASANKAEAWLASEQEAASAILAEASQVRVAKDRLGRFAFLERPRLESVAHALGLFCQVVWADDPKHWLER